MKLKYSIAPLLFAALLSGTGCQEEAEVYPAVYMTDAQKQPRQVDDGRRGPGQNVVHGLLLGLARQDVHVKIEVQPQLIDAFNRKYGKNYRVPAENCYAISATETVIEAGFSTSSPVEFTVTSIDGFAEGVTYCVPVSITSVSGGMRVLEPSRTLYIVLKTPVISKAIYLGSGERL